MNYQFINIGLTQSKKNITYAPAHELFQKIYQNHKYKFLFESKDISPIYGRLSLAGIDPIIHLSGKNNEFSIESLNERGESFLSKLTKDDFSICDDVELKQKSISGKVEKDTGQIEETKRSKRKNIAQIIRLLIEKFHVNQKTFLGFYGGFSYDFVRLFEDIPNLLPDNDIPDFNLFLYDSFIYFDHLKEKTDIIVFREDDKKGAIALNEIENQIMAGEDNHPTYKIKNAKFDLEQKEYEEMVEMARKYSLEGELFEVVFSNILKADFRGDTYALYLKYRNINPSPYLFYFDFGDNHLVGASPEMMVRCEDGKVHLRPISGTARRGKDPIADHENMLKLLSCKKERSELDMLIDLGRNDLSRICKPGIEISDYRFVEKYSAVMHTVAHLTGELSEGNTALDALFACINAGTLTGAPKVAAMTAIEKHEKERRGYYGGNIGYVTFSGDMDTGIIIRTAHIQGDKLRLQVGATLLYDSVPEKEYQETINKAQAFLNTFT